MFGEDSIEERQENELEVLKSIYGEDLEDLRSKSVWNKWEPLNLSINLLPLRGNSDFQEIYVNVKLHIICSNTYPNTIPEILLEKSQGISNSTLSDLRSQLLARAEQLIGEVMIFELAEHVKSFLHCHNKPGTKSLYEEMLISQKQKEQLEMEAQQLEKDREKQVILKEIQLRHEILKEETRLQKENRYSSENSNDGSDPTNKRNSLTRSIDESFCEHKGTVLIEFSNNGERQIQRGRCIDHSHGNCITYVGMDNETGDMLVVSEWDINTDSISDMSTIQRQVSSIEQELNYLVKLKHENLAKYLNIKHSYKKDDSKISLYVLKEFIYGSNCADLLISGKPIDVDMLKHIAHGVLSALEFLHRNNVIHKEVCDCNVFISKRGTVKLTNYSLDKRLSDVVSQKNLSSYSKKTDIYRFGILILSLLSASEVNEDVPDIPQVTPNDMYDFITKCLEQDEKTRFTAPQLLNHQFLKCSIERFSPQRNLEDNNQVRSISPENPVTELKLLTHSNSTGQSRVQNEFVVLHCLGKGAYGEVFKVQNKLDQGYYAIKRIELNPKNKHLNRKIIREVKLLSRLNHENVVRYYNSWIETGIIENIDSSPSTADPSAAPVLPKVIQQNELTFKEDIEILAPPIKDVEWSISYEGKSKNAREESGSSDDESSDDDWGVMLGNVESDSDGIEFERSSKDETTCTKSNSSLPSKSTDVVDSVMGFREVQYMYIQMEFCEKSTLRTAIDASLYSDKDRVQRLFREIIEGLAHIHQQGMIHRDLKPVNIFLDSNDHVKIGDFGLATTNLLSRPNDTTLVNKSYFESDGTDVSLTGHIGTALYVAPELMSASKAIYNQKVDIYSLGIIYFEMCYKPLNTSMERITILNNLRSKEIIFPKDFKELCDFKQELIIRWLLNQDIAKRPTSIELLQSEHVPPPVLEERELRELVRHTLNNPHLKAYKYLIASCFKQPVSCAQDIIYDRDPSIPSNYRHMQVYDYVKKSVIKIFRLHGGQNLSTPLLMPKNKYYENVDSCVKLMTHFGSIVTLPHDLRVPFARYVAWNGITLLRRYSIERVYWEKKVFGYIPRECFECAFDIVTPTPGSFMADAELFYMLKEIMDNLPGLKDKNFLIRLNHTLLIKAILLHCGIKEKHSEIYRILSDHREGKVTKFQIQTHLISLGLSDNTIVTLFNLLESEAPIHKIITHFQMITKKKSSEASTLVEQAFQDLKHIVHNIEAFGVEYTIVVTPGLASSNRQYSGMMFQLACELRKKHKRGGMDVLAVGGRYDGLIASYRNILEKANMLGKDIRQSAVGVSLYLDKLVQALVKDQSDEISKLSNLDVLVCSVGSKTLLKEKAKILTELWCTGIKASLIDTISNEEIQEQCTELNIQHVIILKDTELGTVRVRHWERDRFMEKKINRSELTEYMQRSLKLWNNNCNEQTSTTLLLKSDSKVIYNERSEQHNHEPSVNIVFITATKLAAHVRKRYENQIRSQLDNVCQKLTGEVVTLTLSIDASVIRTLASYLIFENDAEYNQSVTNVIEKHQRHKEYLIKVCDEINDRKTRRTNPTIILYSLIDAFYKVLL